MVMVNDMMTRQEIDKEIKFLFNEAQVTHSERLHLLGDLAEGKYKRPNIIMAT